MPHFFLPRLKQGSENTLAPLDQPGRWEARPAAYINDVINSLDVALPAEETRGIPDPWAHALAFETHLREESRTRKPSRYRGEWRGLLALLALREYRNLSQMRVIDCDLAASRSAFAQRLRATMPSATISTDASWTALAIINFGSTPIGMTSPSTLVVPAIDYVGVIDKAAVPWYDGERLRDPVPSLAGTERELLSGWVFELLTRLSNNPGLDNTAASWLTVSKELAEFSKDLGDGAAKLGIVLPLKQRGKSLGIPRGFLAGLDDPISAALSPESFFTDSLIVIPQADAIPGSVPIAGIKDLHLSDRGAITPLLPLRESLIGEYSPSEITEGLTFSSSGNEVSVTFQLTAHDTSGAARPLKITKTYSSSKIVVQAAAPILELWPNVAGWNRYYCYWAASTSETFHARPFPVTDDRRELVTEGGWRKQIYCLEAWPHGFICTTEDKQSVQGVVLVSKPVQPENRGGQLRVGVDFGTTGTSVYCANGNGAPEPLNFKSRLFRVTASNDTDRLVVDDDFVPSRQVPHSILSVYTAFPAATVSAMDAATSGRASSISSRAPAVGSQLRPLVDGHIYFIRLAKTYSPTTPGVCTDLKWGTPQDRTRSRVFLEQLCLHIAAEAALTGSSQVSWRFSVPSAFSRNDLSTFSNIWQHITEQCAETTGVTAVDAQPTVMTESKATAIFFESTGAPLLSGSVCIDIGGGTSDIAVWQGQNQLKNELKIESSIRLAGRVIFLMPLLRNPQFFQKLDTSLDLSSLKEYAPNTSAFLAAADALLLERGQALLRSLPIHADEPEVATFIDLLRIGIAGIFYYAGMLLRRGFNEGIYDPVLPSFYIGGNGAKLLHWACAGAFSVDHAFVETLRTVVRCASTISADSGSSFDIVLSDRPKSEVSYGLVADSVLLSTPRNAERTISGETFVQTDGVQSAWDTLVSPELLAAGGIIVSRKLEHLSTLLTIVNPDRAEKPAIYRKIAELVDQELLKLAQPIKDKRADEDPKNLIRVEPIFILALKKYLEIKADEWGKKFME